MIDTDAKHSSLLSNPPASVLLLSTTDTFVPHYIFVTKSTNFPSKPGKPLMSTTTCTGVYKHSLSLLREMLFYSNLWGQNLLLYKMNKQFVRH